MHRCPICDYTTQYSHNLKRHVLTHTRNPRDNQNPSLVCDWCNATFANQQNRNRHMKARCPHNPTNVLNVDSDVPNVDSHVPNVDSDVLNVDSDVPKVDSDVLNVHSLDYAYDDLESHMSFRSRSSSSFPCPTCFRVFQRPSKLEQHKPLCKGVKCVLECPKCHQIFSSSSSKSHHMKRCTYVEPTHSMYPNIVNNSNITNNTTNNNNNITNNNCNTNTTNINKFMQNNNLTQNITINGIGKEYLGHLTPDFLAIQAQKYHGDGVLKCIEAVHFNPEYPENQNLRAIANPGVPKKTIAVFENDKWTMREGFFVLRQIIQTYVLTMKHRVAQEDFKKRVAPDEWMQIWQRLCSFNIDDNPNEVCAVFRDIHNMMARVEKVFIDNV